MLTVCGERIKNFELEETLNLVIKWILPIVQAVISVVLLYLVITGGFLPGTYMALIAGLVAVLFVITFMLMRSSKSAVRIIGAVLAILASGVLLTGAFYVHRVLKTLDRVSEEKAQVSTFVVTVESGNAAQTIEDTSGYRFGLLSDMDEELTEKICGEIAGANGDAGAGTSGAVEEGANGAADDGANESAEANANEDLNASLSGLHTESFESPAVMAQALLDGEIDACVFNKAYTDMLDEIIEGYSSKTRVIYEMEIVSAPAEGAGANGISAGEASAEGDTAGNITGDTTENTESAASSDIALTEKPFTVLISGIDVRGAITTTSRSDVNILMTVNPKMHKILLTTTPRDYYVYIPEVSGDMRDKLTHAGIYGVKASMRTLGNLYDIEVSDYIRINFDSVIRLVDALGGVEVNSDYAFTTRNGKYSFNEGTNHLNGEQALAFSRERYAFKDGDNQRGRNQMAVLTAMLNKLQSPALLKNPGEVLDVVGESMQTSFTRDEITGLISWQLSEGQSWEITRQAVSGHGDSQQTYSMKGTNLYVMWPDEESVAEASEKIKEITEEQ